MIQRHGFTLNDLLVAIVAAMLACTAGCFVIRSALRDANRSGCQANLKSIGTAILEHGRANYGAFPRQDAQADAIPVAYLDSDTLADISSHAINTVFVMIADGRVPVTGFKCPAHTDYVSRIANSKYGWTQNDEFSFGIQYLNNSRQQTDGTATATANAADPADSTYDANMIVMADKNPTTVAHDAPTGEPTSGVSGTLDHSNHTGEGLSYLTKCGNVAFLEDDDGSVVDGDEIYMSDVQDASDIGPDADDDVMIVADPA